MANRFWRAQVTIPMDSGTAVDAIQNVTHWETSQLQSEADNMSEIVDKLQTFYTALQAYLPGEVATTFDVKLYDLEDPQPRLPKLVDTITVVPSSVDGFPHEVCLVLTLEGTPVSGGNQRRRRGRLYFGPIAESFSLRVNGNIYTDVGIQDTLRDAGEVLAAPGGTFGVQLSIYSPTTDATGTLEDSFTAVERGHVDNAFDTQRRRGPAATSRLTFAF